MHWLIYVIIPIQIVSAIGLILVVLLQSGKGTSAMAAFGMGGGGETFFGSRGVGNFLTRTTTILAVVFMASCIVLTFLFRGVETVMEGAETETPARQTGVLPSEVGEPEAGAGQPAEEAAPAGGGETEPISGGE